MDSTLNEFLNEINEIVPLKPKPEAKKCYWKECLDAKSGFAYYWNIKTDEVTWFEPKNFIPLKSTHGNEVSKHPFTSNELVKKMKDSVKIYKLAPSCNKSSNPPAPNEKPHLNSQLIPQKKKRRQSGSDDEKITLITSYGSESESDEEKDIDAIKSPHRHMSEDEDDILSTVRKRAEELKMLPQEDITIPGIAEETPEHSKSESIPGFSLVAGYDSNSDEEVEEKINQTKSVVEDQKKESHSTLFPIVTPLDVNDFIKRETKVKHESDVQENCFDTKNFQRKRRLGIDFTSSTKSNMNALAMNLDGERRGLGFSSDNTSTSTIMSKSSQSFYENFTRGGVEFFKKENQESENATIEESDEKVDMDKIKGAYEILHDKLSFLCEGNKNVMPVQIILIQIETLFGALRAESLKASYLYDWLGGTSEDLIKLEKEAAPDGWILQWDRSEKRYYYHNLTTGEGQWEYPQSDFAQQEDSMDICTTPPPPEIEERQPPLPPSPVGSPSPPPPPIISGPDTHAIPEPPSAPNISTFNASMQPLPPGVDFSESLNYKTELPHSKQNDNINSAFDSFYSELAAMESTSNTSPPSNLEEMQNDSTQEIPMSSETSKKKKKKVKMSQGLSMKKKDVSKLVEKWKNVQKNY